MSEVKCRGASIRFQVEELLVHTIAVFADKPGAEIPGCIGDPFRPGVIHIEAQVIRETLDEGRLPGVIGQALRIIRIDRLRQIWVGSQSGEAVDSIGGPKQNELNPSSSD